MRIEFDKKEHCYSVNGDIASISVTELLSKHGLAPNYENVSEYILRTARERGNEVHKDCENIINDENYVPNTDEGKAFLEWVKENIESAVAEQMIAYDYKGMVIAGTADLVAFMKDGTRIIADHKTSAILNTEYVSWQVSLLDYFFRKLGEEKLNGRKFIWKGAQKLLCLHYPYGDTLKEVVLDQVPDEEIEKLLECEYKGEKYQRPALVLDSALIKDIETAEETMAMLETEYKKAESRAKELRERLCKAFEQQNIKSWESPNGKIKVTYVLPMDKISVDSVKLKKEYPQVYTKCQKISKQKAYVRVKVKEDDEF